MPESGSRNDPYSGFNFTVIIDGVTEAGFSEVSGLTMETDIIEYRNGDEDITVRKLPGLKKYSNITLKRGFTEDAKKLWEWRKKVLDGKTQRTTGKITLLNEARGEGVTWNFSEGWPCKLEAPALNAKSNEVAIETLEIAVENIEFAS